MNRRAVLALSATAVGGVAGCLGGVDASGLDGGADPLYPAGREVPADAATHDLYVENFDDTSYLATVSVVRSGDGALVWEATYEALDRRGFSIPGMLVGGRTYEITVDVKDGGRATTEEAMESCPHDGGSRNVGAWIEDAEVTYRRDHCDEIRVGAQLSYADHERFVVE